MTEADKSLIEALMRLRGASPAGYGDFCDALDAYAARARDTILAAPLDALPNAQGRAQSLRDLSETVRKAPEHAAKMLAGRK